MVTRFDPYGRPYRQPSLADYQQLVQAYRTLQAEHEALVSRFQRQQAALEQQERQIAQLQRELQRNANRPDATGQLAELRRALEASQAANADLAHSLQQARLQVQALEAELEASRQTGQERAPARDANEWRDQALRLQADMENFKKRQERRYAQNAADERRRLMQDMLPLADHLEMGLQHLRDDPEVASNPRFQSYVANFESTLRAFQEALRRHGIERMDATGQSFDPQVHEAVGTQPSDSVPEGHVVQTLQAGYVEDQKLLRPARVMVSSGKPEHQE